MSIRRELKKIANFIKASFSTESFSNPQEPKISANIICYNNIASIETCLKSLDGVVDEIVVVDGGSTDGSIEILEKYNCKIMVNKVWQGYSFQRNLAIKHSTGDWILKIDSDEFLSPDLAKNLRKLCRSKIYSGYKTYSRWIQNIPEGLLACLKSNAINCAIDFKQPRYIDKYHKIGRYKSVLRLCRKTPGLEFRGDMHEAIFGLGNLRIKKLARDRNNIYHLDVAIHSFETRYEKVKSREAILPGSGHGEEYLPELFDDMDMKIMPVEDLDLLSYLQVSELQKVHV